MAQHVFATDHLLSYFLSDPHIVQSSGSVSISQSKDDGFVSRTPAVNFYASVSSRESAVPRSAPLGSASSSSSSLSSMAATLVSGGPIMPRYHQNDASRRPSLSPPSMSPISPAATMGTPQENLMLPPPPRHPTDQAEAERRIQHVAWLNQVNAMAVMNQQQVIVTSSYALAPVTVYPPPHSTQATQSQTQQESEERRARRLARNRESARQSRRRKKENLARLSTMVNNLQAEIELERRLRLNEMEFNLQKLRQKAIVEIENKTIDLSIPVANTITEDILGFELIKDMLDSFGPNCTIRQNCTSFQFSALKQLMLPKYQVFILWLTMQQEGFFTAGKEEKLKVDPSKAFGRLSSKQIGEEITTKWKKALPTTSLKNQNHLSDSQQIYEEDERYIKAGPDEPNRLWPLLCFELSISVDQEEKLLQLFRAARESKTLPTNRSEMCDAAKMLGNIKYGLLNHGQSTAGRCENLYLSTLRPNQSAKFLNWYSKNSDRILSASSDSRQDLGLEKEKPCTLSGLCKKLEDVLTITKHEETPNFAT
jgi:hypothetical protein